MGAGVEAVPSSAGPVLGFVLRPLLDRLHAGRLTVVTPSGQRYAGATARNPGPDAILVLHRWRTLRRLVVGGDVGFAEAYMDGDWSSPDLAALIELAAVNDAALERMLAGFMPARLVNRLSHALKRNTRRGSRRNIMAHYDLGNEFYGQWLDAGMSYSSALYGRRSQSLEDAQTAKQDRIIDALGLTGGAHVLEIGCGWGGMVERLVRRGCRVTGLPLSPAQLAYAQARLARAGLADKADLRLEDYRDVTGTFDRIVSIEMIEAVGQDYWPAFFRCLHDRLKQGGTAVVQAITIADDRLASYARHPDFIQRYIFPGGMLPSPAVMLRQSAAVGLTCSTELLFGSSYAETLAEWQRRFEAAWALIARQGFDEAFKRKWVYYLAYCAGGFRSGAIDVGLYRMAHLHD